MAALERLEVLRLFRLSLPESVPVFRNNFGKLLLVYVLAAWAGRLTVPGP